MFIWFRNVINCHESHGSIVDKQKDNKLSHAIDN